MLLIMQTSAVINQPLGMDWRGFLNTGPLDGAA